MGQGQSTREIAEKLRLSVKTIETHQARLEEKLSQRTSRELVQYAIEYVLVEKSENLTEPRL